MKYIFTCYGHENITCKHKTTLEFTKDNDLSLKGDCIAGVKADFSLVQLRKFIKSLGSNNKITIIMETINNYYNNKNSDKIENNEDNNKIMNNRNKNITTIEKNKIKNDAAENKIIEKINAEINPGFDSDGEMVIRKSDYADKRTFAIKADKAACELNVELVDFLKDRNAVIGICLEKRY